MNIKTKYDIGDKVWYYIKQINKYAWGKVVSLDVSTRVGTNEITYHVENRFVLKDDCVSIHDFRDFYYQTFIDLHEDWAFETEKQLIEKLNLEYEKKMDDMDELKKRWF